MNLYKAKEKEKMTENREAKWYEVLACLLPAGAVLVTPWFTNDSFKDRVKEFVRGKSQESGIERVVEAEVLPVGVPKKYVERIGRIEAAMTINDLREPPSMKFKKMEGFDNRFSIRINDQYRLEFEINFEDEEKTFGSVLILDASNHYN